LEKLQIEGNTALRNGLYLIAESCYSSAIELNRNDPNLYILRSLANYHQRKYLNALKDAESALQLRPEFAKGHRRKAKALIALGECEKARVAVQEGLGHVPNDEKLRQCERELQQIRASFERNVAELTSEGDKALFSGRIELAIDFFTQAITIETKKPQLYLKRSHALFLASMFPQSIQDASDAIALSPNLAEAYFQRAKSQLRIDKKAPARQDLINAIRLDPHNQQYKATLSAIDEQSERDQIAAFSIGSAIAAGLIAGIAILAMKK